MKNLTEIIFLLDKSGSMQPKGSEPISGYNQFIKDQSDPSLGEAKVTLVLFGTYINTIYACKDIKEVEPISEKDYKAEGMTALRDAIGKTFDEVGLRLANTPEDERPDKVLVCILSDGDDTSSVEYSTEQINQKITEQSEKYSWNIQFMGTTKNAIAAAKSYNVSLRNIMLFDDTGEGVNDAYMDQTKRATLYRKSVV